MQSMNALHNNDTNFEEGQGYSAVMKLFEWSEPGYYDVSQRSPTLLIT